MNLPLLRSLLTTENPFNSTDEVLAWIAQRNREVEVRVEQTPFAAMKGWGFDPETGNLVPMLPPVLSSRKMSRPTLWSPASPPS